MKLGDNYTCLPVCLSAILNLSGLTPVAKDTLNIVSKGFDITVFKSLRIFDGILYGPVAFFTYILDISASISDADVGNRKIVSYVMVAEIFVWCGISTGHGLCKIAVEDICNHFQFNYINVVTSYLCCYIFALRRL